MGINKLQRSANVCWSIVYCTIQSQQSNVDVFGRMPHLTTTLATGRVSTYSRLLCSEIDERRLYYIFICLQVMAKQFYPLKSGMANSKVNTNKSACIVWCSAFVYKVNRHSAWRTDTHTHRNVKTSQIPISNNNTTTGQWKQLNLTFSWRIMWKSWKSL